MNVLAVKTGKTSSQVGGDMCSTHFSTCFSLETPMGQMPVLSVDGVMFCQTKTIGRLLAKRFSEFTIGKQRDIIDETTFV